MDVPEVSSLEKETVNNVAAIADLHSLVRSKPVRGVGAEGNSLASDRGVADDVPLIGVAVEKPGIPVEEADVRCLNQTRKIGERGFSPEIKMRQAGYVREIQPGIVRRTSRITDRRIFVFDERIVVQRKPVAEL